MKIMCIIGFHSWDGCKCSACGKTRDQDPEDLITAAFEGKLEVVQALLDNGADVNATKYEGNYTALRYASMKGHQEVVKALLDNGADVNAKDKDGATALLFASMNGHQEVVKVLIDNGADVNAKD